MLIIGIKTTTFPRRAVKLNSSRKHLYSSLCLVLFTLVKSYKFTTLYIEARLGEGGNSKLPWASAITYETLPDLLHAYCKCNEHAQYIKMNLRRACRLNKRFDIVVLFSSLFIRSLLIFYLKSLNKNSFYGARAVFHGMRAL